MHCAVGVWAITSIGELRTSERRTNKALERMTRTGEGSSARTEMGGNEASAWTTSTLIVALRVTFFITLSLEQSAGNAEVTRRTIL